MICCVCSRGQRGSKWERKQWKTKKYKWTILLSPFNFYLLCAPIWLSLLFTCKIGIPIFALTITDSVITKIKWNVVYKGAFEIKHNVNRGIIITIITLLAAQYSKKNFDSNFFEGLFKKLEENVNKFFNSVHLAKRTFWKVGQKFKYNFS